MRKPIALTACAAAVLLIVISADPASAETASAAKIEAAATVNPAAASVVKNFYAQLSDVMKQGDQLGYAGRFRKLAPVVHTAFNLPLMTRVALGLLWNTSSPAEQDQITKAFSEFSVATYASRFVKYDGEQFDVTGEQTVPGGVIVETTLTPKDGDAVALNYLLRQDEQGAWRIVDVFLNGSISEIATRRAEFAAVVRRDGIAALVDSLSEKSKQMGPS